MVACSTSVRHGSLHQFPYSSLRVSEDTHCPLKKVKQWATSRFHTACFLLHIIIDQNTLRVHYCCLVIALWRPSFKFRMFTRYQCLISPKSSARQPCFFNVDLGNYEIQRRIYCCDKMFTWQAVHSWNGLTRKPEGFGISWGYGSFLTRQTKRSKRNITAVSN
jgi:hypothetical protein